MSATLERLENRLLEGIEEYRSAFSISKAIKKDLLISRVDNIARKPEGIAFIYEHIPDISNSGFFQNSVWENPQHLVPALAGGTLLSGHPTSTVELLSQLRLFAIAEGKIEMEGYSAGEARGFLESTLVVNFEFLEEDFSSPVWENYSKGELKKIRNLFDVYREKIPLNSIKPKLAEEAELLAAHRLVVTGKLRRILQAIYREVHLDDKKESDRKLAQFCKALFKPTDLAEKYPDHEKYAAALDQFGKRKLLSECRTCGEYMSSTGLVSYHQLILLRHVSKEFPELIPEVLHLDDHGRAEYERHSAFIRMMIDEFLVPGTLQGAYGLARVLQRNLLSRKVTLNALNRLTRIKLHRHIASVVGKSKMSTYEATPIQILISGTLCILGLPLGIRQGNNPTCQSARGLSMWSRHAPGKLINILMDAATTNNIVMRYEGELIESATSKEGLITRFDAKLDPVSIVLVPHLDKIYNEMMRLAAVKHPGKDPHISVNPAFYGHWIQTGFTSVYDPLTNAIREFDKFVRIFYASYHPKYNGGQDIIYPVPLGIFITDTKANMLGYHAISLLRVEEDPQGEWRAYFFNPNSESKQNWGQGIMPAVAGNGERSGESSLPMYQFASRVYAYHYNYLRLGEKYKRVPKGIVSEIRKLARESWGRNYVWIAY